MNGMLNIIQLMYCLHLNVVLWQNSGVAALNIEARRYTNVPLNERLCTLCDKHQVENMT